ncbi:MAG: DUF6261 family protein [Bacteroidales bacterium]|jgi:Skp family chaperone for outer membrane proteins|nr:DUF6261 family protein [Bacteroidales bacterium]
MKIKKIHLEYLRNEAHYQFMLLVQKLFAAYPATSDIVADLIPALLDLTKTEGQLVDALKASQYTEQIAEADRRVDRDITGINAAIASALRHYDPAVAKAARELEVRMKSIRGEIAKKAYGEESAAVKILLADLRNIYTSQVTLLGLSGWVTELNEAQAAFEQLFILRNSELAARPQEKLQAVRKEINSVYRSIVERIDAYGILNSIDITRKFIGELNREVEYFNEHSRQHAKMDIDKAAVASIPDQIWEGKPVIVLPVVTYEGDELVFTKDYELSYRDNVHPGTAAVLIHGKGTFQGLKTVSFNIK